MWVLFLGWLHYMCAVVALWRLLGTWGSAGRWAGQQSHAGTGVHCINHSCYQQAAWGPVAQFAVAVALVKGRTPAALQWLGVEA